MTPLRRKMAEDLRLRNLAPGTRDQYLRHVARFARYFGRSPDTLGADQVRAFLLHLLGLGLAPATCIVYHAALRFLFTETLGRPEVMATVPRPRKGPDKEPVPLLREEVAALLRAAVAQPFDYTFFATLLATGLRISETCALRTEDLDGRGGLLHVRRGKGGKARTVMLGERHLRLLRRYWVVEQPPGPWVFPAQRLLSPGKVDPVHRWSDHPVLQNTMRDRLGAVVRRSGLRRPVTPHDLRRTFATWLLESSVDLRTVQVLLGHASPETTTRYAAVRPELIRRTPSPLDLL
jgi:integrase/recombinase XerD